MQETVNQETENKATENNETTQAPEKTFTQDEVNKIINKRFAEYKTLQEKAKKLDEIEEAAKSELQKATEKAAELQTKLDAMEKEKEIRGIRDEVAKSAGVPSNLLTADTKDECEAQAKSLLEFAGKATYPNVKDGGEVRGNIKTSTRQQFAEWFNNHI